MGASFRTSKISVRERISRRLSRAREEGFQFDGTVSESSVLETCNRLEVYLVSRDPGRAAMSVMRRLRPTGASPKNFYVKTGIDAIRHILNVAAGMDSPVLGEEQILLQVRDAGLTARTSGQAKTILPSLFDVAFNSGRRIRDSYKASSANMSVSTFALKRALKELGHHPASVLLIGSGETAKLAALKLKGSKVYLLSGRRDLGTRFPRAVRISRRELRSVARKCDLVIAATRHRGYVLTRREVPGKRRIVILDLGFPRNVDPSVEDFKSVRLYDLDDVAAWAGSISREGLASAQGMVDHEAQRFNARLTADRLTPTLANIYRWADRIRHEETLDALRKLQNLSPRERTIVEVMAKRLTSKLMSPHASFVKEVGSGIDQKERLLLLDSIFRGEAQ